MKLTVVSDLHLEFGSMNIDNSQGADVLILAGDIFLAKKPEDATDFLKKAADNFKHVIAIAGNHEFYNSEYHKALQEVRDIYTEYDITFLENDFVVIDECAFIGATLWTDLNKKDWFTIQALAHSMNDFSAIKLKRLDGVYRRFIPVDSYDFHRVSKRFIFEKVKDYEKAVVITHHAPSYASIHTKYLANTNLNGGYATELSDEILDNSNIKLWVHGHTHESFDYMIGSTRVICNPRGYTGYETNRTFNPNLVVEV